MFKNQEDDYKKEEKKKEVKATTSSSEKFSEREKQFLHKKKLKTKADILLDK